jgi:hypothetical protein
MMKESFEVAKTLAWTLLDGGIQAPWKMAKKFLQGARPTRPRLGLPRGPAVAEHGAPLGARMQIWFINDGRFGRPSIQQVTFEITYVRCHFLNYKTEVHSRLFS